MKKVILLFSLVHFCFIISHCQIIGADNLKNKNSDTTIGWTKGGFFSVNINQTSLSNWAAGGQNAISSHGLLNVWLGYGKGKGRWENNLELGYGAIRQGKNSPWWKSDDKFDFSSKYSRNITQDWYYVALANFKTQMTPGYNFPNDSMKISDAISPGYLIAALGANYLQDTSLALLLAPFTAKTTFVTDQVLADAGAFGVDPAEYDNSGNRITPGKTIRAEVGSFLRFLYRKNVQENILLQSKLDLFSNYLITPQNIDISWEMLIAMKINKFFSANITTHLLYDDDIDIAVDSNSDGIIDQAGPRTQFKETLAIGISYKF